MIHRRGLTVLLILLTTCLPAAIAGAQTEAGSDGLTAIAHHIVLLPEAGGLRVAETIRLANTGPEATVEAMLPMFLGAGRVELLDGFDGATTSRGEGVLRAAVALPPQSERTFTYAYLLPPLEPPFAWTRPIVHPTDQLTVMLAEESGWTVLGERLIYAGPADFAGLHVDVWQAANVAPVTEWVLGLQLLAAPPLAERGVPVIDHNTSYQGAWRPITAGYAILTVWIGVSWLRRRRRRRLNGIDLDVPLDDVAAWDEHRREQWSRQLVEAGARLERERRQGKIPEHVYREERQALLHAWKHLHLAGETGGESG